MQVESFAVVVIGGGPGGYVAALRAANLGASVALVEEDLIGGTCLNRGCIPTKALLESVKLLRRASRASELGLTIENAHANPEAIASRSQSIVKLMRKGVEDLLAAKRVKVIRGRASLASPNQVDVVRGGETVSLRATAVLLAAGSSWRDLPDAAVDGRSIITSDHALELERPTDSMVIVGGGAVGCEIAEIYSGLGATVTVVEMMDHLLPTEDAEIAKRLEAVLKRKNITVYTSARVEGIGRSGGEVEVRLAGGKTLGASRVLLAVGRRPNLQGLGLEKVGVKTDRTGVVTDTRLATSVPGVFAAGDVTGKYLLAHVAMAQGIVAAENMCGKSTQVSYEAVPRCVYTDPECAAVGLDEKQASNAGAAPHVYKLRLGRIGRVLTLGESFGFAKMVCDGPGGRVLGFHVLAPHASELVAEVGLAIKQGLSAEAIAEVIHPHPTLSEIVWEAALGAAGKHIHGD